MFEAEFWVAVAFVLFIAVLGYFQVHKFIVKGIDDRRDRIKAELDEARVLKEEALALLAQYEEKKQAAEQEAAAIVSGAKALQRKQRSPWRAATATASTATTAAVELRASTRSEKRPGEGNPPARPTVRRHPTPAVVRRVAGRR